MNKRGAESKTFRRANKALLYKCACLGLLALLLSFTAAFCFTSLNRKVNAATVTFLIGDGSAGNPYQIHTRDDLDFMANAINYTTSPDRYHIYKNKHYIVMADIDMGGSARPWNNSIGNTDIAFNGTFDGNDKIISNLYISTSAVKTQYGLFGYTSSTSAVPTIIKNVNLTGVNISLTGSTASNYVGGLIGRLNTSSSNSYAIVENCTVSGSIKVTTGEYIGGMIGGTTDSSLGRKNISFSRAMVDINAVGTNGAGGFVGSSISADYRECYATGSVTGTANNARIGGFAGVTSSGISTFSNCYATGNVTATNSAAATSKTANSRLSVGGFLGTNTITGTTIQNCYAAGEVKASATSGVASCGGIMGFSGVGTVAAKILNSAAINASVSNNTTTSDSRSVDRIGNMYSSMANTDNNNNYMLSTMTNTLNSTTPWASGSNVYGYATKYINREITMAEFTQKATYENPVPSVLTEPAGLGWDFTVVWGINQGSLPHLRAFETKGAGDFTGRGTSDDPFKISTVAMMKSISANTSLGYNYLNTHFRLENDLTLTDDFVPIGTSSAPFAGNFDFNYKTIKGLKVNSTVLGAGLFGYIKGATISNLTIENAQINSTANNVGVLAGAAVGWNDVRNIVIDGGSVSASSSLNVGGLIGDASLTSNGLLIAIYNCHVSANVYGGGNAGGIIGTGVGVSITNCSATGNVMLGNQSSASTSYRNVGGLVGNMPSTVSVDYNIISNSYASGRVEDINTVPALTSSPAGGLVGYNVRPLFVNGSYFSGSVYVKNNSPNTGSLDSAYAGGFVGLVDASVTVTFQNSFMAASSIRAESSTMNVGTGKYSIQVSRYIVADTSYSSLVMTNCYHSTNTTLHMAFYYGTYKVEDTEEDFPSFAITNKNAYGEDKSSALAEGDFKTSTIFTRSIVMGGLAWNMNSVWIIRGVDYPIHRYISPVGTIAEDYGTISNPIKISTASELRAFRDDVNNGNTYLGMYIELAADINLDKVAWTPIGIGTNATTYFRGNFDGKNYRIKGLYVNRTASKKGLFGDVRGSVIKNLIIEEPLFDRVSGSYCGAIAGQAYNAQFINCHVIGGAIQSTSSYIGSIVGYLGIYTSSNSGYAIQVSNRIENCSSSSDVVGGSYTGGITGYAQDITMNKTFYTGSLRSSQTTGSYNYAGGLVGYLTTSLSMNMITQCYNSGLMSVRAYHVGGLIGYNSGSSYISDCYNNASITNTYYGYYTSSSDYSFLSTGGIIGYNSSTLQVRNVYNSGDIIMPDVSGGTSTNNRTCIGGILGYTSTANVILRGIIHIGSITTNMPAYTMSHFVGYCDNVASSVIGNSDKYYFSDSSIINNTQTFTSSGYIFGHGNETETKRTQAQLMGSGLSWLAFYLNANNADWDERFWVAAPPKYPQLLDMPTVVPALPPVGTYENPILINNEQDFINFRNNVNGGNRYSGSYIAVTRDLDLSGTNWTPIGTESNYFGGNIDFRNNVVRGLDINTSVQYQGLFGYVKENVTIKNLKIENPRVKSSTTYIAPLLGSVLGGIVEIDNVHVTGGNGYIEGTGYVSGFVAAASNSAILSFVMRNCSSDATVKSTGAYSAGLIVTVNHSNVANAEFIVTGCAFTGTLTGTTYAGGILGNITSVSNGTRLIEKSYVGARIFATQYVGGLVGQAIRLSIDQCYTSGSIQSTSSYVGGVVGRVYSVESTITNCFSDMGVMSTGYVGGIVGGATVLSTVKNCYAAGNVTVTSSSYAGGIVGAYTIAAVNNKIVDSHYIGKSIMGLAQTAAYLAKIANGTGSDYVPTSSGVARVTALGAVELGYTTQSNSLAYASNNVTAKTIEDYRTSETYVNWDFSGIWEINAAVNNGLPTLKNNVYRGPISGSEGNPYQISTYEDLVALQTAVNSGNRYRDQYFSLINEIDMSEKPAWTKIGNSSSNFFAGVFDGKGNSIKGLNMTGSTYLGLFGYVNGATIRNLNMINPQIVYTSTMSYSGVIVAYSLSNLYIEECSVYGGKISGSTGSMYVGGLVGYAAMFNNKIINSYAETNVTGGTYIGGIIGAGLNLEIDGCYYSGTMNATSTSTSDMAFAGGIVGYVPEGISGASVRISNSYSRGIINATNTSTSGAAIGGGIVGRVAHSGLVVEKCYSAAKIVATIPASGTSYAYACGIIGLTTNPSISTVTSVATVTVKDCAVVNDSLQCIGGTAAARLRAAIIGVNNLGSESNSITSSNNYVSESTVAARTDDRTVANYQANNTVSMENPLQWFKTGTSYGQIRLDWDTAEIWNLSAGINNGLPYLRNMPINLDLLKNAIKDAEAIIAAKDYRFDLLEFLEDATDAGKVLLGTSNIQLEPMLNAVGGINLAKANLRADVTRLQAYLVEIQPIVENKESYSSFAMVEAMIDSAVSVINGADVDTGSNFYTNTHAVVAEDNLRNAISALSVDKSILTQLILEANKFENGVYTAASWEVFEGALVAANLVAAVPSADPAAIIKAVNDLRDAMDGLVPDMGELASLLEDALAIYNKYEPTMQTAEPAFLQPQWGNFCGELNVADTIYKKGNNATLVEIKNAVYYLELAMNMLLPNKAPLTALYNSNKTLSSQGYEIVSWTYFEQMLNAAYAVLTDSNAKITDIENATNNLVAARAGLLVDVGKLLEAIAEAERLVTVYNNGVSPESGTDDWHWLEGAKAMPESYANMVTALGEAKAVRDDVVNKTASEVISATDKLVATLDNVTANSIRLQLHIDNAKKIVKGYLDTSWDALQVVISDAQVYSSNQEQHTSAGLKGWITAINDAIDALRVDKALIRVELDKVLALNEIEYTAETWDEMWEIYKDLLSIHNNFYYPSFTLEDIAEINGLIADLKAAVSHLAVDTSYKTALAASITRVNGELVSTNYTSASWQLMLIEYNKAYSVYINQNSKAVDYITAKDSLDLAIANLQINVMVLSDKISQAEELIAKGAVPGTDKSFYASQWLSTLQSKIDDAVLGAANPALRFDEMDNLIAAIDSAMLNPQVDKTALRDLIDSVAVLNESDYLSASWADVQDAKNRANIFVDIYNKVDQLVVEYQILQNAIDGLRADKSLLVLAISDAGKIDEQFVNKEHASWDTFLLELENANYINGLLGAKASEVAAAVSALNSAVNNLAVDKTFFNEVVNEWSTHLEAWYVSGWEDFSDAFVAAQAAQGATVTVKSLQSTYSDLMLAINGLRADKTGLIEKVNEANLLDSTAYTVESYAELAAALTVAQGILQNIHATGREVIDAIDSVNGKMNLLVGDKSELNAIILVAQQKNSTYYTIDSWTALQNRLTNFSIPLSNQADAFKIDIDAEIAVLSSLIDGLVFSSTVLDNLIAQVYALDSREWTSDSFQAVGFALEDAQAAEGNERVEAIDALISTIGALVRVVELNAILGIVNELDEGKYAPADWAKLETLLEKNEYLLTSGTSVEVNKQVNDIKDALYALIFGEVESYAATDFTKNSWDSFKILYDIESERYLTSDFSIELMDEIMQHLEVAKSSLVSVKELRIAVGKAEAIMKAIERDELKFNQFVALTLNALIMSIEGADALYESGLRSAVLAKTAELNAALENLSFDFSYVDSDYTANSYSEFLAAYDLVVEGLKSQSVDADAFKVVLGDMIGAINSLVNVTALKAALAIAESKSEANYTTDSWTQLQEAISGVSDLLVSGDGAAVSAKTEQINSAVASLSIDKKTLQTLIEMVIGESLKSADYTTASWSAFNSAFGIAQLELASLTSNEVTMITARDNLQAAYSGLVNIVALQSVIDQISSLNMSDYEASSFSAFWAAYSAIDFDASSLFASGTREEVDGITLQLNEALDKLVFDISALQNLYDLVKDYVSDHYTFSSWTAFSVALSGASAELGKETHDAEDIKTARNNLQTAINGLVSIKELKDIYAIASALISEEQANILAGTPSYTEISFANLQSAATSVTSLYMNGQASAVASKVDAIQKAIKNLRAWGSLDADDEFVFVDESPAESIWDFVYADGSSAKDHVYGEDEGVVYMTNIAPGQTIIEILMQFNNDTVVIVDSNGDEITDVSKAIATGYKLQIKDGDDILNEVMLVVMGDVNGDGNINLYDLLAIASHSVGTNSLSDAGILAAGFTESINVFTILTLCDYVLGTDIFSEIRV